MLKIEIPSDKDKIKKQIEALKFQIVRDISEVDKNIHQQAINDLEKVLNS